MYVGAKWECRRLWNDPEDEEERYVRSESLQGGVGRAKKEGRLLQEAKTVYKKTLRSCSKNLFGNNS